MQFNVSRQCDFFQNHLSITFLNPKFLVSFFYKNQPNMGSKMREIKLQKIVENLLDKLRQLYLNGTVNQKFLVVLKQKEIVGNICLISERIIYRKQSLGAPESCAKITSHPGESGRFPFNKNSVLKFIHWIVIYPMDTAPSSVSTSGAWEICCFSGSVGNFNYW